MARRRQSGFEGWVELAALMPWWASLLLAALIYAGLHHVANMQLPRPIDMQGFGSFAGQQLWIVLAGFLQYLIPAALVVGALISAIQQHKRAQLHETVRQRSERSALFEMSWREFEQLVHEHFRQQGFSVTDTGGRGADGGRDLVLRRGADKYLVQCKQWRANKVGVEIVRELLGAMAAEGAIGGYVVTSGTFTKDATAFADGRSIQLVDGAQLTRALAVRPAAAAPSVVAKPVDDPACPICKGAMTLRTARRGANTGQRFWGCQRYPDCRGTRPATTGT